MTGYGRAEAAGARAALSVECKSVNHRHLDISLKLPRAIASLEPDVRRRVQSAVARGRVEVTVGVAPASGGAPNALTVNLPQAREYAEIGRRLVNELQLSGGPTLDWLAGQPGVITREAEPAISAEESWPLLEEALTRALGELQSRRETEGQALALELEALHRGLAAHVDLMAERAPAAADRRAERLRDRIRSLLGEARLDEGRIATEVAAYAEKIDITEELTRLRAHLGELAALVREGGTVGRTLDFLIQELNREVNTVGSKADDLEISQAVIAAKATLEKLREQAQNIE
ncbi:MAG TPA: YicC/YloC family endoribonuclease [Candidatus Methylomirabilis sp.]|nr:YicC/YloC family endoribonuclease [Candidatus Methylomirabilis sp.]